MTTEIVISTTVVELVIDTQPEMQVIETFGEQGPAGVNGIDGAPTAVGTAGQSISGHRAVLVGTDGLVRYASAQNPDHLGRVGGVAMNAGLPGDEIRFVSFGDLEEPSWDWDVDLPVYLGADGHLTQTEPVTGFLQIIGMPAGPTKLFVDIQPPFILE